MSEEQEESTRINPKLLRFKEIWGHLTYFQEWGLGWDSGRPDPLFSRNLPVLFRDGRRYNNERTSMSRDRYQNWGGVE